MIKSKQKLRRLDKHGHMLGVGDKIRVVGVPPGLEDDDDAPIKTVFERCLGRMFAIRDFDDYRVELYVGRVMGEKSYLQSIYLEPEFIELVWSKATSKVNRGRKSTKRRPVLK